MRRNLCSITSPRPYPFSVAIQRRKLRIGFPRPVSAAIISAATTAAKELPMARRMPLRVNGRVAIGMNGTPLEATPRFRFTGRAKLARNNSIPSCGRHRPTRQSTLFWLAGG